MCEVDSTLCAWSNIYWLKLMCNGADELSADRRGVSLHIFVCTWRMWCETCVFTLYQFKSQFLQSVWWRELGRWKDLMHFDWDWIIMAGQLSQKPSNHKDQGVLPNSEGLYTLRDKPCVDDMVL